MTSSNEASTKGDDQTPKPGFVRATAQSGLDLVKKYPVTTISTAGILLRGTIVGSALGVLVSEEGREALGELRESTYQGLNSIAEALKPPHRS